MQGKTLLVTGSRSIRDASIVYAKLDALCAPDAYPDCVIHGGAIGVDTLAGAWANAHGIKVKVFRPNFKTYPVSKYRFKAYTVRDRAMVDEADVVVAIWDGRSSGTKLTFEYAESVGKLDEVIIL